MPIRLSRRAFVLATLATAGGAGGAHSDGSGPAMVITGELAYLQRIALPDNALAIVELKPSDAVDGESVTAESRMQLRGAQVPIAFELTVERAWLDPAKTYFLRGAILTDGVLSWLSEPVEVDTAKDTVRVGTLMLSQHEAPAPFGMSDPALIVGPEWNVIAIDGRPLAEGTQVTITFDAGGFFHGGACNRFRGGYEIDGGKLALGNAAATMMACEETAMAQEGALFEAFKRVASWRRDGDDTLLLADASGASLIAARR